MALRGDLDNFSTFGLYEGRDGDAPAYPHPGFMSKLRNLALSLFSPTVVVPELPKVDITDEVARINQQLSTDLPLVTRGSAVRTADVLRQAVSQNQQQVQTRMQAVQHRMQAVQASLQERLDRSLNWTTIEESSSREMPLREFEEMHRRMREEITQALGVPAQYFQLRTAVTTAEDISPNAPAPPVEPLKVPDFKPGRIIQLDDES